MKFYSNQKRIEVIELYRSTMMSIRAVGKANCVKHPTVHQWVMAAGISRTRNVCRGPSQETKNEAYRLYYEEEMSLNAVSDKIGISRNSISRWLKEMGRRPLRSHGVSTGMAVIKYSWKTIKEVGRLKIEGKVYREISDITGIPKGTLPGLFAKFNQFTTPNEKNKTGIEPVRVLRS